MVPHWVRGTEEAALVTPVARPLRVLGLGGSVSTPKGGITAQVVVMHDFEELEAQGRRRSRARSCSTTSRCRRARRPRARGYGDVVAVSRARRVARGEARCGRRCSCARSPRTACARRTPARCATTRAAEDPGGRGHRRGRDADRAARRAGSGDACGCSSSRSSSPTRESANVIGELRGTREARRDRRDRRAPRLVGRRAGRARRRRRLRDDDAGARRC